VTVSTSLSPAGTPSASSTPQCLPGYGLTLSGALTADASSSDGSGSAATFNAPQGLSAPAAGSAGPLFVAETGGNKIRSVALDSGAATTLAGSGLAAFANGVGTNNAFNAPAALCRSADGAQLFVADTGNGRIRAIAIASRVVTTLAGAGGPDSGAADGAGSVAGFSQPAAIAASATTVYVADTGNFLIRAINIASATVTTLAGSPRSERRRAS